MKTWIITSQYDGNISFPVQANTILDAAILALEELGYSICREEDEDEE